MPLFNIWYARKFKGDEIAGLTMANLHYTHLQVGSIQAESKRHAFQMLQADGPYSAWGSILPSNKPLLCGLFHTSMSQGDVLVDTDVKRGYQCVRGGWNELPLGDHEGHNNPLCQIWREDLLWLLAEVKVMVPDPLVAQGIHNRIVSYASVQVDEGQVEAYAERMRELHRVSLGN